MDHDLIQMFLTLAAMLALSAVLPLIMTGDEDESN